MQIKDCNCREGRAEEKPVSLTCAILTYCCPECGGGVASVSDYLHGIVQQVEQLRADLYQALGDVAAPGRAIVGECSDCEGRGCGRCASSGLVLWRACPKCSDVGYDFLNGRDESHGMVCRIGCGFKWAADDPRWLAQRLPARSQAA